MAKNPVIFGAFQKDPGFTAYAATLSEFAWRDQLVGITSRGYVEVTGENVTARWMSGPMACKATQPVCSEAAELCKRNGVACTSHVDPTGLEGSR